MVCICKATYARTWVQGVNHIDGIAICVSMFFVVLVSVILGTTLPRLLLKMGFDPAHAAASLNVMVDIVGICLTCLVSVFIINTVDKLNHRPPSLAEGNVDSAHRHNNHSVFLF